MQKYALGLAYNGSAYYGWQIQDNDLPTVQSLLQHALSQIANHPITVITAGRTDKGVHATSQVVHFCSDAVRHRDAWVRGANRYLPATIRVNWVKPVDDNFHARFSAKSRRYCYLLSTERVPTALYPSMISYDRRQFNVDHMQQAANFLLGEHDFSSFRAAQCQAKHPVRTVLRANICRHAELILIDLAANGFLHHMVRNITGVLMRIGAGEQPIDWMQAVLRAKNRQLADITAPSDGLYLIHISYEDNYHLPSEPIWPFFMQKNSIEIKS